MKKLTAGWVEKSRYTPIKGEGGKNPGALLGNRISDPEYPGLYLFISPHGAKSFRFDFRFPASASGVRQCLTYGAYPVLTLAEAREMQRQAKRDLAAGINPAAKKQEQKRKIVKITENTYEKVSALWFEAAKARKPTGQKEKKRPARPKSSSWIESAERWSEATNKVIGHKPMSAITKEDVLATALI